MTKKCDTDLLRDFAGRLCELCMSSTQTCAHHILARGMGSGGRLDVAMNLVSVCDPCHRLIHLGHIKRALLFKLVGWREGMDPEAVETELYRLRRGKK